MSKIYSTDFGVTNAAKEAVSSVSDAVVGTTGKVTETVRNATSQAVKSMFGAPATTAMSGAKLLFGLSVGALVLFMVLTFIHYTVTPVFSFGPGDTGVIPMPTASNKQVRFQYTNAASNMSAEFTDLISTNVSFRFDLSVMDTFATTAPRVVWYRAAAPVALTATATEAALPELFPSSNVVFFVDGLKNDLKVMLRYQPPDGQPQTIIETCVENLPIKTPVRIGFTVFSRFVEVYKNGALVKTVPAPAPLVDTTVAGTNIYGPPATVGSSMGVKNMIYWPYIISPKQFRIDSAEPVLPGLFLTS